MRDDYKKRRQRYLRYYRRLNRGLSLEEVAAGCRRANYDIFTMLVRIRKEGHLFRVGSAAYEYETDVMQQLYKEGKDQYTISDTFQRVISPESIVKRLRDRGEPISNEYMDVRLPRPAITRPPRISYDDVLNFMRIEITDHRGVIYGLDVTIYCGPNDFTLAIAETKGEEITLKGERTVAWSSEWRREVYDIIEERHKRLKATHGVTASRGASATYYRRFFRYIERLVPEALIDATE